MTHLAYYASDTVDTVTPSNDETCEQCILRLRPAAVAAGLGIYIVPDGRGVPTPQTILDLVRPGDVLGLEIDGLAPDTLDAFDAESARLHALGLAQCPCLGFQRASVAENAAMIVRCAQIASRDGWIGISRFAQGRTDTDLASLAPYFTQWFSSLDMWPRAWPVPPPVPLPNPEPEPMPLPTKVVLPFVAPGVVFTVVPTGAQYSLVTDTPPDARGCPAGLYLGSLPPAGPPSGYPSVPQLPASNVSPFHLLPAAQADQTTFVLSPTGQFFVNTAWGTIAAVAYVATV